MLAVLSQVSKTYRTSGATVAALRSVSLELASGEFVAVCGPSGCGKSTLLLVLGGLLKPESGQVQIEQTSLYELTANRRAQFRAATLGFVFQQFYLVPYLSVVDNVLAARLGLPAESTQGVRARADELIAQLGLSERRHHRPAQLSTGERQRVALARALLNQPKLLLADEPTGNLDRENANVVLAQFEAFRDRGGSVLLVTHDSHAAGRADRQVLLRGGEVVV